MSLLISSNKNPRIKFLSSLEKARERKNQGVFVIEGFREVSLAQQSGFEMVTFYIQPEIYSPQNEYPIELNGQDVLHLTADVFSSIAYRENTEGIIAIAKIKETSLNQLEKKSNGLYLILEHIEKPGNLGAMLRTADAAGIDGVIVCDPATDLFNPNVVRSSVGCLFTLPVVKASNEEVLNWSRKNKVKLFAAELGATKKYFECDFKSSVAFLMGSEANGLSEFWLQNADEKIIIPMKGKIDSMNVSNAAAILIYEAVRQRSN